jgi:hypothetical protein
VKKEREIFCNGITDQIILQGIFLKLALHSTFSKCISP